MYYFRAFQPHFNRRKRRVLLLHPRQQASLSVVLMGEFKIDAAEGASKSAQRVPELAQYHRECVRSGNSKSVQEIRWCRKTPHGRRHFTPTFLNLICGTVRWTLRKKRMQRQKIYEACIFEFWSSQLFNVLSCSRASQSKRGMANFYRMHGT